MDIVKGDHQISFGGNWIHTKIETLNNRPTNGAFSFNGQGTGLSLADFMMGVVSGGVLQGNPVYDYDDHDYIGAYVQDDWRLRSDLSVNLGIRWEPFIPIRNTYSWVSNFDMTRFDQGIKSKVYPQAPAGLYFPGDEGYDGPRRVEAQDGPVRSAPGRDSGRPGATARRASAPAGACSTRRRTCSSIPASRTTRRGARRSRSPTRSAAGRIRTWATRAATPSRRSIPIGRRQPFPAFGVYVNAPFDMKPTVTQQWNVSMQRQVGDWMFAGTYLGNKSMHLWRATELNPAVYAAGATTGNTNQRRVLILKNPVQGQAYGTIGQVDDTGKGIYNAMLLSAQRRMKKNLSVLANWTLSKCMSDPATSEITGPTIVDPNNPDLDYSYCASDRRHVVNLSAVMVVPEFKNGTMNAVFSDWQVSPIVRWQSGNRSSITTGVDNALTGMGGQRAVQILDDPYGDGTAGNYLNRAAYTSPATGTYSTLAPFTVVNPSRFTNDLAITRSFKFGTGQSFQFRWEIFNVINYVNLNPPTTALNSANFGKILGAGDPRIMQFALKVDF